MTPPATLPPWVILDRDGVINQDSDHYIKCVAEWLPIPGSLAAIGKLCQAGIRIAVATNQSGVGRGYFNEAGLTAIHTAMTQAVAAQGGRIDIIAYCPHTPDDGCQCRKPKPGLLRQIAQTTGTQLAGIPLVGDSLTDLQAADRAGATAHLVLTGKGRRTAAALPARHTYSVHADLLAFTTHLLGG